MKMNRKEPVKTYGYDTQERGPGKHTSNEYEYHIDNTAGVVLLEPFYQKCGVKRPTQQTNTNIRKSKTQKQCLQSVWQGRRFSYREDCGNVQHDSGKGKKNVHATITNAS